MKPEQIKSELKTKFTYISGYGVTMEPKAFEDIFKWICNRVSPKWYDADVIQPTHKSNVLVITNEDGNVFYHVAQFHDGEWSTHSEILHYVTLWMELPNP